MVCPHSSFAKGHVGVCLFNAYLHIPFWPVDCCLECGEVFLQFSGFREWLFERFVPFWDGSFCIDYHV